MFEWIVEYINVWLKTTSQPPAGEVFFEHEELYNMSKDELEQYGRDVFDIELDKRLRQETLVDIILELMEEKP
jgi:hypothetical protein